MLKYFKSVSVFGILVAIVTVISITIFVSVQQTYRSGANDPQIEASEEIVRLLNQGVPPEGIVGQTPGIDIAKSLSLFVIIFDKDSKVVVGSGKINDKVPEPSSSVFEKLKKKSELRFTWEPEKNVRVAAIMKKADNNSGYVLVAKNLREIEKRQMNLFVLVGIVWLVLMGLAHLLSKLILQNLSPTLTVVEEVVNVEMPNQNS